MTQLGISPSFVSSYNIFVLKCEKYLPPSSFQSSRFIFKHYFQSLFSSLKTKTKRSLSAVLLERFLFVSTSHLVKVWAVTEFRRRFVVWGELLLVPVGGFADRARGSTCAEGVWYKEVPFSFLLFSLGNADWPLCSSLIFRSYIVWVNG